LGTRSGDKTAVADSNRSSGTISGASLGSVGSSGTISGGSLTGINVDPTRPSSDLAQGAGTITDISLGSLSGHMTAVEDANPSSGTISGASLGSVGSTGTISGGSLTGINVDGDMAGTITAQGAGTITDISLGSLSGH